MSAISGTNGGLLQHYTIRCDDCSTVKDWVFLMGGGWRKCVDCYEKEHGPQPAARSEIKRYEDYKKQKQSDADFTNHHEEASNEFWSGING